MGSFAYAFEIGDFEGHRFVPIEALVDTGATYRSIPEGILDELGVEPTEEREFVLANGQRNIYRIGWVRIRLDGREQPTLVIFADRGSRPLLGAFALEGFGLAVDPIAKRLIPAAGFLVGIQEVE